MKRVCLLAAVLVVIVVVWRWPAASLPGPPAPLQLRPAGSAPPESAIGRTEAGAAVWSPPIRVNLTPKPVLEVTIAIDGPWLARAVGSPLVLARGERLAACEAHPSAAGIRLGATELRASHIELLPERSPAIWVGEHQYRGSIRLYRRPGGRLLAVNVVPLEEYVASVVDSEMPIAFGEPAREAQAIAARTFALSRMQENRTHPYFDVHATVQSQKYLGFQYRASAGRRLAGESESSRRVAARTAGMVCTWRGRVFGTYYSAVCGGRTRQGDGVFSDAAPVLQSVACDWCREAELYRWRRSVSREEVIAAARSIVKARGETLAATRPVSIQPTPAGEETAGVIVKSGGREYRVSGDELRRALAPGKLPSPHFTVRDEGGTVMFEGRGHGHGVGLCQWGARGQGLAGRTPLQILQHYYPGSAVVRITAGE